jgi:hypothetical protein
MLQGTQLTYRRIVERAPDMEADAAVEKEGAYGHADRDSYAVANCGVEMHRHWHHQESECDGYDEAADEML